MLFIDQIKAKGALLRPEFERLFSLALANQNHPGDLLLILENGSYNPDVLNYPGLKPNPHVIGPGKEGMAYNTSYQFINAYRQRVYIKTHAEYLAEFDALVKAQNWAERDKLEQEEAMSIQLETLIYLKIWESDFLLKRLYEFVRILLGESFEWGFTADSRHKVIRLQIRDKVRPLSETLYTSIATAYKSQIRNSIAHSNYSIMSRNLHPNNDDATSPYPQIRNLPFDEWIDMFHITLAIYNELIGLGNKIRRHYATLASTQNNEVEVLVPDKNGQLRSTTIIYRPEWDDFSYKQ